MTVKFKAMAWYGPKMMMTLDQIAEIAGDDDAIADDLLIKEGNFNSLQDAFKSWGIDDNDSVKLVKAAYWDNVSEMWRWYSNEDCRCVIRLLNEPE